MLKLDGDGGMFLLWIHENSPIVNFEIKLKCTYGLFREWS